MDKAKRQKIALIGNPNAGKTSLFNVLTGLNQKVGNFPGVTVEKKEGVCKLSANKVVKVIDLPGTYSLYPRSLDEKVVFDTLLDPKSEDHPDAVVVIVDASNLKRNLLLFTQIRDLGIPVVLALNMLDVATNLGQRIRPTILAKELDVPVVSVNARSGQGINLLKQYLEEGVTLMDTKICDVRKLAPEVIDVIKARYHSKNDYAAYLLAQQASFINSITAEEKAFITNLNKVHGFNNEYLQSKETVERYQYIDKLIKKAVDYDIAKNKNITDQIDKILTHKVYGYATFLLILFMIFQAIFAWASAPMDMIDELFTNLSQWTKDTLPEGVFTNLLAEGVIPGVGGVLMFIPQIAVLFTFISILEESGYMSRAVFLMDKLMRRYGLNGKSVVPLISGVACAIPAIMAARTIGSWKERLITIFVTPFMSCSARLPVYTVLIALIIPEYKLFGILNVQGLALMGLYLFGFIMAIASAWVLKHLLKSNEKSYFIMELPLFKVPRWKNVGIHIYDQSKAFAFEAGKIILTISVILWVLASYGPGDHIENAEKYVLELNQGNLTPQEFDKKVDAYRLQHSYAGVLGHTIEPVITPLGFDWKIGIALITSFAAREVFVGTMATIYSVGAGDDEVSTLKSKMRSDRHADTGEPVYTVAVGISLLIFYALAMQCMSTLAITKRETRSWKWPLLQLLYMTGSAYIYSLIAYQVLSRVL